MIVFWRLIAVLLINDFVLRPKKFNDWKANGFLINTAFTALLMLLACAADYKYLGETWFSLGGLRLSGVPSLFLFCVFYYLIERIFNTRILRADTFKQTTKILWHKTLLLLGVFIISPDIGIAHTRNLVPEPWTAALCGFLLSTGFAARLISGGEYDFYEVTEPSRDEVYVTALQRALMFLICLLPGYSWIVLCAVWFGVSVYAVRQRFFDVSPFNLYFGSGFAFALGLLARAAVYYL